jgi:carboxyl-terminal processing protease
MMKRIALNLGIILSGLGIGFGLSFLKTQRESNFVGPVKTIEQYWSETGLSDSNLESLLQDKQCKSSIKYFLACASSINAMANQLNLDVSFSGNITDHVSIEELTQKQQTKPWIDLYRNYPELTRKVSFEKIWNSLKNKCALDNKPHLVAIGINGYLSVFQDPHTYLLPSAYFKEVMSKTNPKTSLLGISLGKKPQGYYVRKIWPGSLADKSGLQKGDLLLRVNNHEVKNLDLNKVLSLLKANLGETTSLSYSRNSNVKNINIFRTQEEMPSLSSKIIDSENQIGLVSLSKFANHSCTQVKEALIKLNEQKITNLILDLRDNPGGLMEEAACISSLFVGPSPEIFTVHYEDKIYSGQLVILINGGSASTSEIVAGSLQDLNRAILVGDRSYGKGSFQEGDPWLQNRNIAIFKTKGFYYLPSGRSPQMVGLEPDVKVEDSFDSLRFRESDQFVNALSAPLRKTTKRPHPQISLEKCIGDLSNLGDEQLNKALQILSCKDVLAGLHQ